MKKIWILALSLGVVGTAFASLNLPPETALESSSLGLNEVIAPPVFSPQIEAFLNDLALCESGSSSTIKVLDSNNEFSYGMYQFQLGTFYGYGLKYGILPADLELAEAENRIYEANTQRVIAGKMIEDGLYGHWYNCSHKLGRI